jgi:hypothetical protein
MLTIFVPVSHADQALIDGWVSTFRAIGGAPKCHVVISPTPMMRSKATYMAGALQGYALSVETVPLEIEPKGGYPKVANMHFMYTMLNRRKLDKGRATMPFLWMELDSTFTVPNADSQIWTQYLVECGGSGFLGVLMPYIQDIRQVPRGTDPMKVEPVRVVNDNDPYMEAICVYPADFDDMVDRMYVNVDGKEGWDQKLRNYAKRNWHVTDLIQHRWRTHNYRLVDGAIVGDNHPSNPHGTDHSGPIYSNTVLFHGCKDTSLFQILCEAYGSKIEPVEKLGANRKPEAVAMPKTFQANSPVVPVNPQKAVFKPYSPHGTPAQTPKQSLQIPTVTSAPKPVAASPEEPQGHEFQNSYSDSEEDVFPEAPGIFTQTPDPVLPVVDGLKPVVDRLQSNSGKSIMLKKLAKETGIKYQDLKAMAAAPNSGLQVKGPAEWVSLAATA